MDLEKGDTLRISVDHERGHLTSIQLYNDEHGDGYLLEAEIETEDTFVVTAKRSGVHYLLVNAFDQAKVKIEAKRFPETTPIPGSGSQYNWELFEEDIFVSNTEFPIEFEEGDHLRIFVDNIFGFQAIVTVWGGPNQETVFDKQVKTQGVFVIELPASGVYRVQIIPSKASMRIEVDR